MSLTISLPSLPSDDSLTEGVIARRIVAWFCDAILIGLVLASLWVLLLTLGVVTLGLAFPMLGLLPLVPFFYHTLFLLSGLSATPGQCLFGLIVRRNIDFGRPLPLQAVGSTLLFYLTLAAGVVWLAVALITVRRRTLHDLLSGLVVVRRQALAAGR